MAMIFGRFEILNELSKSDTALIYKATDTETNQTVALKTQNLEPLGEASSAFVDTLIAEGESTRDLTTQNIAALYGAGEIEGQFCAAMEYVQGNSIATMLTRKEGFSIWDLLDITRQVCAGLDAAAATGVCHHSLEPSKIMVQWDGLCKILGYGISSMSLISAETGNGLGRLLPYASPEQVRGDSIDLRSNLFTWGAVLYEMVTDRRAFDAADPVELATQIADQMPPSPSTINPKIQAGVSALIMKALAKDPADRYQTAQELVDDLEKCKENKKSAPEGKKTAPATKATIAPAARAAAASKFVASVAKAPETDLSDDWTPPAPAPGPSPAPRASAAVAAAGAGASPVSPFESSSSGSLSGSSAGSSSSGARMMEAPAPAPPSPFSSPVMSAAIAEPETAAPKSFDPMMGAAAPGASTGKSFSDMDELPPMKEPVFTAPAPPPPAPEVAEPSALSSLRRHTDDKPKIQVREAADRAMTEIKTLPPQLMMYSILGAVVLILIVAVGVYMHVRSEDDDSSSAPRPTKRVVTTQESAPVPQPLQIEPPPVDPEPEVTVRQLDKRAPAPAPRKKTSAPVPVVLPGSVQIDSSPEGAQVQLDDKTDPSWITPFSLSGITPGQHTISVSKAGYSADSRAVQIASGSRSTLSLHLAPINALVVLNSTPVGADILLDGKTTGRVTPAQFAVEKGAHTIVLRKQGYLDETSSADLGAGQNFQFAPVLRALGNAEGIRSVGKLKKMFGGGGDNTTGMGSMSVRTQPKGAQIAVNNRLFEKNSPTEFMLGPGNYVIDITLTGFKPIHKVVTVEKGGKVAIDEIMERQ
jgi:serine/threonine protein kinase